jgi:hypothetical protein
MCLKSAYTWVQMIPALWNTKAEIYMDYGVKKNQVVGIRHLMVVRAGILTAYFYVCFPCMEEMPCRPSLFTLALILASEVAFGY